MQIDFRNAAGIKRERRSEGEYRENTREINLLPVKKRPASLRRI